MNVDEPDPCACRHRYDEHDEHGCRRTLDYPGQNAQVSCHCKRYRKTWELGDNA